MKVPITALASSGLPKSCKWMPLLPERPDEALDGGGTPATRFRFPRFEDTMDSDLVKRQERPIVQSWLNLDHFLPGFTPSWRHLISDEVGSSSLPRPIGLTGFRGPRYTLDSRATLVVGRLSRSRVADPLDRIQRRTSLAGTMARPVDRPQ